MKVTDGRRADSKRLGKTEAVPEPLSAILQRKTYRIHLCGWLRNRACSSNVKVYRDPPADKSKAVDLPAQGYSQKKWPGSRRSHQHESSEKAEFAPLHHTGLAVRLSWSPEYKAVF
jgi:hypothetical protein